MTTKTNIIRTLNPLTAALALAVSAILLGGTHAQAQCTEIVSGLHQPLGTLLTDQGNLLVAESGTPDLQSGRISIIDPSGQQRTLLDGLPSGPSDVGDPSGPAGILLRGRDLYVLIGVGDVGIAGPRPGTTLVNPNGPSSPIFSSVLAIHLSAAVERMTGGFTLTVDDQQALADCATVTLSNGKRDRITIRRVVDFPDYIPFPLPDVPDNIQVSNPYGEAAFGNMLYVTDGGRNLLWQVDLAARSFAPLVMFPDIPNPLFPVGGPFLQAVPTGIAGVGGKLLVTLLRGAPFPTGTSTVEQIDPATGSDTTFISNLTTAIGIIPLTTKAGTTYFVLEASSAGPFFAGNGDVLRFDDPAGAPVVLADCLSLPSSMTLNRRTSALYVTEVDGSLVAIPFR